MMKMESKKSRRLRWLDCFLGPKNSNSNWLQENLDEINENVGRKLKIIEDSDADSIKAEIYNESRQEINKFIDKCCATLIPSQGISSNVSSGISESRPHLSKLRSSKHPNTAECSVVSKQLKRGLSETESKRNRRKRSAVEYKLEKQSSVTESDDYDELEDDLLDMIEKLYIQMEWDRVVSIMLQHRILRPYEDDGQVKESNVDKALLEETLELHGEICRRLNEMSYLEEYNEEINATNLKIFLF